MIRFTIPHHDGETSCNNCGWPLCVGDEAYETEDQEVVCSKQCARELGEETD